MRLTDLWPGKLSSGTVDGRALFAPVLDASRENF